jgi:hypothetical protein
MTPETRAGFILEYIEGDLTDELLAAKYGLDEYQLKTAVHIGTGNIIKPEPLTRGLKRGMRNSVAVTKLATETLDAEDMAVSPLQSAEVIEPKSRDLALYLNNAELSFANNVLRGMNATAAAAASFEIFNKQLADKKAAELLRSSHVADYLASMKGRSLFAPVRNKAYLEAVLWQVIDRGLQLKQEFDNLTGLPVEGQCKYDPKSVIAASALLSRLKGWDNVEQGQGESETQRDRLRRLQANFKQIGE